MNILLDTKLDKVLTTGILIKPILPYIIVGLFIIAIGIIIYICKKRHKI